MKKLIFIILLTALLGTAAHAATLRGGNFVCGSEDSFLQLMKEAGSMDDTVFKYLLRTKCTFLRKGINLEVTILERTDSFAKLRLVNAKNEVANLWVMNDSVDEY